MASRDPPSPSMSPISRKSKSCARRCERSCCNVITYFPLVFVYGLTTWAVWVNAKIGFLPTKNTWTGNTTAWIGIVLYTLLNWAYTTAVFTDPGSPLNTANAYSSLPSQESQISSFTVKSSGELRFCKKCQVRKPDRAHHCSSCQRCVLKMDHHCPWLATCVGFENYKPFLLFLIYTCIFCYLCFAASATWVWREIINEVDITDQLMPVNYILLAVMSGIFGLVLGGFTGWHIHLACSGRTTLESLEATRYLAPMRQSMQKQLDRNYMHPEDSSVSDQLLQIHANALPGVTRPEEGQSHTSPAQRALRNNISEIERARDRERYDHYLDERDSERLPNAFDLGWRRNLIHVFGKRRLIWCLPICNTTGDGCQWEPSPKWLSANEDLAKEREARLRENRAFERERVWSNCNGMVDFRGSPSRTHHRPPPQSQRFGGPPPPQLRNPVVESLSRGASPGRVSASEDEYPSSDDGETMQQKQFPSTGPPTANWNDIPDHFMQLPKGGLRGNQSRSGDENGKDRSRSRGSPSPFGTTIRGHG